MKAASSWRTGSSGAVRREPSASSSGGSEPSSRKVGRSFTSNSRTLKMMWHTFSREIDSAGVSLKSSSAAAAKTVRCRTLALRLDDLLASQWPPWRPP